MESMSLLKLEIILHWLALFLYIGAAICFVQGVVFKKEKSFPVAALVLIAGLLPHTLALLVRWFYVYHGPYLSKYEVLSSNAWVTVVMFLFFTHRYPRIRFSGMFVAPFGMLISKWTAMEAFISMDSLVAPLMIVFLAFFANNLALFWILMELTTILSAILIVTLNARENITAALKYVFIASSAMLFSFIGLLLVSSVSCIPLFALYTYCRRRQGGPGAPEHPISLGASPTA